MVDALVHAKGLSRSFDIGLATFPVLRSADLTLMPGDRVAVIGPSGGGKTTLLHLIGGIDEPTAGSISWPALGSISKLRPGKIGIAFQGPSLLDPLTIVENVGLPLLLMGEDERTAAARASELLAAFGLQDHGHAMPDEISGGQMQRAGLARAIATSPSLLIADEPTGQLDRATSRFVIETTLSLLPDDGALVIATHDEEVAAAMDQRWTLGAGYLDTGVVVRSL